jgi:hypothetical protein
MKHGGDLLLAAKFRLLTAFTKFGRGVVGPGRENQSRNDREHRKHAASRRTDSET